MGMTIIRVDSHIKDVDQEIEKRIKRALSLMGDTVEGYAKEDCPVDTGNLRNSLTHEPGEDCEYVGTNVEYAPYVEFIDGRHHPVGKAHFLRDAAQKNVKELKEVALRTLAANI